MQTIRIVTKHVWGNKNYYIAGSIARTLQKLTGKVIVNTNDIQALRELGFNVEVIDTDELLGDNCE